MLLGRAFRWQAGHTQVLETALATDGALPIAERSGKTRLLEVLASEAIRGPGADVVLDPKGDQELVAQCAAEAHRQCRHSAPLMCH